MTALTLADYANGKGKIVLAITPKDAATGRQNDKRDCPTALAWRRRFPTADVEVGTYATLLTFPDGTSWRIPHSPRLTDTISTFDDGLGFAAGRYTLPEVEQRW